MGRRLGGPLPDSRRRHRGHRQRALRVPGLTPLPDALATGLGAIVGPAHVIAEADQLTSYETDWTGRWAGHARLAVRPGSTAEVAEIIRFCRRERVALVPQGGNTGMVGGGIPMEGEVVLSLRRLSSLEPVDLVAGQVTVGAGVVLGDLQRHARRADCEFAVDLTARESATVGGMVATNAGGVHVLRYGGMRYQVVGVEAVLGTGDVVSRLSGLVKDNTGYDLAGLLCGSEGTLGVVTKARLRLVPNLPNRVTALLALESTAAALAVLAAVRPKLPSLEAAEITFGPEIDLVIAHTGLLKPFPNTPPVCLLLECAAVHDPTDELAGAILELPEVVDTRVADDTAGREQLWSWRERHSEVVQRLGIPHKLDITVPLGELAAFESEVRARVHATFPGATVVLWGHVGDGNLHVNVVGPPPDSDEVDDLVLQLVAAHHGSISAEHGVGRAKRKWLSLTRSPSEIAAMDAIRRALDPDRILNPGVLL